MQRAKHEHIHSNVVSAGAINGWEINGHEVDGGLFDIVLQLMFIDEGASPSFAVLPTVARVAVAVMRAPDVIVPPAVDLVVA